MGSDPFQPWTSTTASTRFAAAKIVLLFAGILGSALVPPFYWPIHLGTAVFLLVLSRRTRLPLRPFFGRVWVVAPFLLLISAASAALPHFSIRALNLILKTVVSLWMVRLFIKTVSLPDFLAGLERLRVPAFFGHLFGFLFRYGQLFWEEWERMQLAQQARTFSRRPAGRLKQLTAGLGLLFVRAYERAERVHLAMLARGYQSAAGDPSRRAEGGRRAERGLDAPT